MIYVSYLLLTLCMHLQRFGYFGKMIKRTKSIKHEYFIGKGNMIHY